MSVEHVPFRVARTSAYAALLLVFLYFEIEFVTPMQVG